MTVAHSLWLIDAILMIFTLLMARDVLGPRGRRARNERRRFLEEAVHQLEQVPENDEIETAWRKLLTLSVVEIAEDPLVSAICALENASDFLVATIREAVRPHINLINNIAEFVDEGLLRPRDLVRQHPKMHAHLLRELALVAPFIWYESILQGRGRWGYRALRLKTVLEKLRPISPRGSVHSPLVIEIESLFFLALPSVTSIQRVWGFLWLSVRSPTINARSKISQVKERNSLAGKLRNVGIGVRYPTQPTSTVEW